MVTASDVLRVHRIAHDGQRDRFMTTCPECSHLRKKETRLLLVGKNYRQCGVVTVVGERYADSGNGSGEVFRKIAEFMGKAPASGSRRSREGVVPDGNGDIVPILISEYGAVVNENTLHRRKHFGSGMPNVAENRLSGIRTFSMTRRCWTKARHLSSRRGFDDALVAIQSSYPTTVSVPNSAAVPKTVTGRKDATSQKRWNIVGIIWID